MNGLDRILELQSLDSTIDRLRARKEALEAQEEVRAARERVEAVEGLLGELRLALDSVDREQRRLEQDVELLSRKIEGEERRLYDGSVANPKELEAIEREVESLKGRRARTEDELLDQMARREELEARLRSTEAELAEARDRLEQVGGEAARELADIDQALAARRAEREALLPEFDPEVLALYGDLRRQKRGIGAAALVDGVCQACHQKLSALYLDRLKKATGIGRCEYCRRIVVFG